MKRKSYISIFRMYRNIRNVDILNLLLYCLFIILYYKYFIADPIAGYGLQFEERKLNSPVPMWLDG